ncbi:MAG: DUF11 domain-containing protein [bacterium]|nr:DUF11 domain-containing protein [bacterium]
MKKSEKKKPEFLSHLQLNKLFDVGGGLPCRLTIYIFNLIKDLLISLINKVSLFYYLLKKILSLLLLFSILILVFDARARVYAEGITVTAGNSFNLNDSTVSVEGDVEIVGTMEATTGTLNLDGDWSNTGTFNAGSDSTVNFNAGAGTQTVTTGGTTAAKTFRNVGHTGAGAVVLNSDEINIDGSFNNAAGTFETSGLDMYVAGNWSNASNFNHSNNDVYLDGTNQTIFGSTTFYRFYKEVTSAATLTFEAGEEQIVQKHVSIKGAVGEILNLRSTAGGSYTYLTVQAGGTQSFAFLNVQDNHAGNGLTLYGGATSASNGHNVNWAFGAVDLVWDGSESTDWNNALNWDVGLTPNAGDNVVIPSAPANQPVLTADVILGDFEVQAGANLIFAGYDMAILNTATIDGTLNLIGSETITAGTWDTDSGTVNYLGNGDGVVDTFTVDDFGANDYFIININDTNATKDIFQTNADLRVVSQLTVTAGTLDVSTNGNTLSTADGGNITVNGGTINAAGGNVDANENIIISSGVFIAPGSGKSFTLEDDFTHSGGTFTHSSGTLTLDGTGQSLTGSTTFFGLSKVVAAADTLTFDNTATQTVVDSLTLQGADGQLLSLRSDLDNNAANLMLQANGSQSINYVDVKDNDASGGVTLIARNGANSNGNTNWEFGSSIITWDGSESRDWDNTKNWDKGLVPSTLDTAIIPDVANDPVLSTNASVANLTIQTGANVSLDGKNLTVSTTLSNEGNINLDGNETLTINTWDNDSGTVTYVGNGDGVVDTRTIVDIGTDPEFYNLVINDTNGTKDIFQTNGNFTTANNLNVTSGTLDISTNTNTMSVNGTMTMDGGTFTATNGNIDANNVTISSGTLTAPTTGKNFLVSGDFTYNGGTFDTNSGTVTLDGTGQALNGNATFYNLTKTVAAADTLTFSNTANQTITNHLVLRGAANQLLSLRSDADGTPAEISLQTDGTQDIAYVDVKDSNASGGVTLVGRTSTNSNGNTNWSFNTATITWDGTTSTDWDVATNWDLGIVPTSIDIAVIAAAGNQPVLSTNVEVTNLTLNAGTTVNLNGKDLTVSSTLSNEGNINMFGSETVSISTVDSDSGTFTYTGDGDVNAETFIVQEIGATDYYNLVINDTNGTKDTFRTNSNITAAGAVNVTLSTLDISTNGNTLTAAGALTVDGGTLTATNGNIDANGAVVVSSGTLTAPTTSKSFTVAGDFTHSGGTFDANSGQVTLDGSNQTLYGDTTFYGLYKSVAASDTLTFEHSKEQTVTDTLTLLGADASNLLALRSTAPGTHAHLTLQVGKAQLLNYLDVQDNHATNGLTLIGRNSTNSDRNDNWQFGNGTLTWDGSESTDWNEPKNWDLGFVPIAGDSATVPNVANQPELTVAASLANLTMEAGTTLGLNGFDLTLTGTLSNEGTIDFQGAETIAIANPDIDSGTFVIVGDGDGSAETFILSDIGTNDFYNLIVNDPNGTKDTFQTNGDITVVNNLNVTAGTLEIANDNTLKVNNNLTVDGGTLNASAGNIDANVDVTISSGVLTAPTTGQTFTVNGDFKHSGGTFTANSGRVTLDGAGQSITGSSTFYDLVKTVTSTDTLTFENGTEQIVTNFVQLEGAASNLLSLRSDSAGDYFFLTSKNVTGTQSLTYLDVKDANSGNGRMMFAGTTSTDNGHNVNWSFGPITLTWTGATSTDWDDPSNWDFGIAPRTDDSAIIPSAPANQPVLSSDVIFTDLTINSGASVTLSGNDITILDEIDNEGTIKMNGSETMTAATWDVASGTVEYVGNGDGTQDTFTIANYGTPSYYNLLINDTNGTTDIFAIAADLQVANNLTVSGGTFNALSNGLDVNGSVTTSGGEFIAPGDGKSFTVADDFLHTGGTFTHSSGTVTFDTAADATISGATTFYNVTSTTAGKNFYFTPGSNQTFENTWRMVGDPNSKITMHSTVAGQKWDVTSPNGIQAVSFIDLQDSDANVNEFICLNCDDSGNNNELWIFTDFMITSPVTGSTTGTEVTFVGVAAPNQEFEIYDENNNSVVSVTAYSNGRFRVVGTVAPGVHEYNLYLNGSPGQSLTNVTAVASPTINQVPEIDSPVENEHVDGVRPTIVGRGKPGAPVLIDAADTNGFLPLTLVGTGTVDADGNYSIQVNQDLPGGVTLISVTVDGVTSAILSINMTDPYGVIFDSSTNRPVKDATITVYTESGKVARPGVEVIGQNPQNPFTTGTDGAYSYVLTPGNYYIQIEAFGYKYPSKLVTFPEDRSIITGSQGEVFVIGEELLHMDHPMDPNGGLVRVTKKANKSEVVVGEVVTYTVTLENLSPSNEVLNVLLEDVIPPGFKYLEGRTIFDGQPISDPEGQRPLYFDIGTMEIGEINTLRYQLVVGSGVEPGVYENAATAVYSTGLALSNRAIESVKVVMDPVFDLGTVVGKIFHDRNGNGVQDAPYYDVDLDMTITEEPIPNVQIATEDGAVITADNNGQFHMKGIIPGRHVFRVDERTLPEGSFVSTGKVAIVDVTKGMLNKVNFGVQYDDGYEATEDERFFNQNVRVVQDRNALEPKLNVSMYNNELLVQGDKLINPAEFRIFTNYAPFVNKWRLDVIDKDTKKVIQSFVGNRKNIYDALIWDGLDRDEKVVKDNRNYSYVLVVEDGKGMVDETQEKDIAIRFLDDKEKYNEDISEERKKEAYQEWIKFESNKNNLKSQSIAIKGETLRIKGATSLSRIKILKGDKTVTDLPLQRVEGLSARKVLEQGIVAQENEEVEVILPIGEYEIQVDSGQVASDRQGSVASGYVPGEVVLTDQQSTVASYTKPVNIGDNYLFFVAMGDGKVGYTRNSGNIEPVQFDDKYQEGFWGEGKLSYFLKGKILGKYAITSSYDSDRSRKELFRNLDPDKYYPVYGDNSSIDYKATETQGPLYLLVEWDKSEFIWGNYNVGFDDTEFTQFNRSLYGGKVHYESVSTTKYGESDTKVVLFRARAKQKVAHNEFLGTGGSLYYMKHKDIIEGSDKVTIEVRDQITGQITQSQEMVTNKDYDIDYEDGRVLFWQPIAMMIQSESIISDDILDGNPVYVVVDYEYQPEDKVDKATIGARAQQALTDSVIVGGTYVQESQETANYTLRGTDMIVHLGDDITVKAEYAESESDASGTYASVDGGITFEELETPDNASDKAYGLRADARLFGRLGVESYYKHVGKGFSSNATSHEQGKKLKGVQATLDLSSVTRFTARHDIQELIEDGNADSSLQVGAAKTSTTNMQVIHEARQLRLTGEYFKHQVEGQEGADQQKVAVRADYQWSENVELSLERESTMDGEKKAETTVGIKARPNEKLTVKAEHTVGTEGSATSLGGEVNASDKVAISADYTVSEDAQGNVSKGTSVGTKIEINEKTKWQSSVGFVQDGENKSGTNMTMGGTVEVDDKTKVDSSISMTETASGKTTAIAIDAFQQVSEKSERTAKLAVDQSPEGTKTSTITFGEKKQLTDEIMLETEKSFASSEGVTTQTSKNTISKDFDGRRVEGSLTKKTEETNDEVTRSNIYGLSGEINDKWAASGSYERGTVKKHDGSEVARQAISLGLGYVDSDEETGKEIKSSTKVEVRRDQGQGDATQYLIYNSTEAKLNHNTTLYSKLELSQTVGDEGELASYKEIVIGGAYRPIKLDRLNLLGRYTFLQGNSPDSQSDISEGVEEETSHTLSAEAIYDLNERWQLAEKFAYKVADEKVEDFDFARTRTWLMIHRLNYKIDHAWKASLEYRMLTQTEAQDAKKGLLFEVTRKLNEFAELGIGYNFTDFNDDLTHLSYMSEGPFVRITGTLYDRTPEEIERARQRWQEERVRVWAWRMVKEELARQDSAVVAEMNYLYRLAKAAEETGKLDDAAKIYRDILMVNQMMLEEAADYIRSQIKWEEKLKECHGRALKAYKEGDYLEARKIWETIIDELKKSPTERLLDKGEFCL